MKRDPERIYLKRILGGMEVYRGGKLALNIRGMVKENGKYKYWAIYSADGKCILQGGGTISKARKEAFGLIEGGFLK